MFPRPIARTIVHRGERGWSPSACRRNSRRAPPQSHRPPEEFDDEKMDHDHRRRRVHELPELHARDDGRDIGNEFPGYAAPMPKHGHHWIDILQKERGQAPMIDIAYVPVMCNHCDNAPCVAKAQGAVTNARTASSSSIRTRRRAAGTSSRPVPTAPSGGTKNSSFRKPGRSTPT